jgi:ATP-binding protein involved in chromosome partitioning
MSYFLCPSDGKRYDIFGSGGGQREAERLNVPLLGQVPIDIPTREAGDKGAPIVIAEPSGAVAQTFAKIAGKLQAMLPA